MPAHQVLPLMLHIFEVGYVARQPYGLTKFRAWTNQNAEIYEQALGH